MGEAQPAVWRRVRSGPGVAAMSWTGAVSVRAVWVRRRPGPLLVPFDVPRLGLDDVIDRRWSLELRSGEPLPLSRWTWLLLPAADEREYLPTYPLPAWDLMPDGWWFPHDWRPKIVTLDVSNYL